MNFTIAFGPHLGLEDSLDSKHSCSYLGVGSGVLRRLRNSHQIESFQVTISRRKRWRYPLRSLELYRRKHRPKKRLWDPKDATADLPRAVAANLLGLKVSSLGALPDLKPETIRAHIIKQLEHKELQAASKRYRTRHRALVQAHKRLAERLKKSQCIGCKRKIALGRKARYNIKKARGLGRAAMPPNVVPFDQSHLQEPR